MATTTTTTTNQNQTKPSNSTRSSICSLAAIVYTANNSHKHNADSRESLMALDGSTELYGALWRASLAGSALHVCPARCLLLQGRLTTFGPTLLNRRWPKCRHENAKWFLFVEPGSLDRWLARSRTEGQQMINDSSWPHIRSAASFNLWLQNNSRKLALS